MLCRNLFFFMKNENELNNKFKKVHFKSHYNNKVKKRLKKHKSEWFASSVYKKYSNERK